MRLDGNGKSLADIPAGWLRLILQVAALLLLAGAAWWRLAAVEQQASGAEDLLQVVNQRLDSQGNRLTGVEVRTLGVEARLERMERKIDRLLDRRRIEDND